jgi:hypothetical protein
VVIREEPMTLLSEHADIPIAFIVDRILGGITFSEVLVDVPWEKDYDTLNGEGPERWPQRFDTSNWVTSQTTRLFRGGCG